MQHTPFDKRVAFNSEEIAIRCARLADEKKADDIVVLKLHDFIADYFVVCSGRNKRQLQTICDEIEAAMKEAGVRKLGIEGRQEGLWVLLDYGDVVVHLFLDEVRRFYDLEFLWSDSTIVEWRDEAGSSNSGLRKGEQVRDEQVDAETQS